MAVDGEFIRIFLWYNCIIIGIFPVDEAADQVDIREGKEGICFVVFNNLNAKKT